MKARAHHAHCPILLAIQALLRRFDGKTRLSHAAYMHLLNLYLGATKAGEKAVPLNCGGTC